jgi:hypothetical protein
MTTQISVNVAEEVDNTLSTMRDIIIAIKNGKTAMQIAESELPALIGLVGQFSSLPSDVTTELCSSLRSVGVRGAEIVSVLIGQYQP